MEHMALNRVSTGWFKGKNIEHLPDFMGNPTVSGSDVPFNQSID